MPAKEEEFIPRAAFASAVTSSQLFGVAAMIMTGIWMSKYEGGFAWDGSDKQFNYHPLFMVIGLVFLNAEGTLQYYYLSKTIHVICGNESIVPGFGSILSQRHNVNVQSSVPQQCMHRPHTL